MIKELIIVSMWCWGVHCLFSEKMIFHPIGRILEKTLGTLVCKPLFICPPCMSSIHGIAWALYFYGPDLKIIPFVICLTGLNYVIKNQIFPEWEETSP